MVRNVLIHLDFLGLFPIVQVKYKDPFPLVSFLQRKNNCKTYEHFEFPQSIYLINLTHPFMIPFFQEP